MSIISSLPEEIQEEVILRMAVRSIFTCKCVCKLWCNLISSSKSIRHHLKLTGTNTNLTSFILMGKSSLCYVEYDSEKSDEQYCKKTVEELFNLRSLGYFDREENIVIVGSCNGLVCLTTKVTKYLCGHVYICNPITQECVKLPTLVPDNKDYQDAGYRIIFYGFGYLPSSNKYKVVRISYKLNCRGNISSGEVHVYTLGEGKGWRDRGEIQASELNSSECQSIFVDGALHWYERASPVIPVFDLTDEKFYMLPTPPLSPSNWANQKVVVLGGHLCIFQGETFDSSDIWFLSKKMDDNSNIKEQDGEDRQSSRIWIKGPNVTMEGMQITKYQPLTITNNGDILLLYKEEWNQEKDDVAVIYDPKASTSKELGDLGLPLPSYGEAAIHVNSYISLKSLGE